MWIESEELRKDFHIISAIQASLIRISGIIRVSMNKEVGGGITLSTKPLGHNIQGEARKCRSLNAKIRVWILFSR